MRKILKFKRIHKVRKSFTVLFNFGKIVQYPANFESQHLKGFFPTFIMIEHRKLTKFEKN
jgi:hypothetical protein